MGNYNFRKDLEIAKKTETQVAKGLETLYNADIKEFKQNSEYDILATINGKDYTFEVKEDFMCIDTGNVALEYESRGKDSGITTSKSDFYIYKIRRKDGDVYIMHTTNTLRRMIERGDYTRIVNGGDRGSNTMNYLFKYDAFVKTGRILPLDKAL